MNIPMKNISKLDELIGKYNKIAATLNKVPLTFSVEPKISDSTGELYFDVTFSGDPLKIDGWEFVGTIDHLDDSNLLKSVPGKEIPEQYRNVSGTCQHCNKKRHRKDTYVCYNSTKNEYKQVGSSCLKDFIGHNPELSLRFLELINDTIGGDCEPRGEYIVSTKVIVATAYAIANKEGWSTKTARSVNYHINPPLKAKDVISITKNDLDKADNIIDYVRGLDGNSFIKNIQTCLNQQYVAVKNMTLTAWAVGVYLKDLEPAKSKFIGSEKEKIVVKVKKVLTRCVYDDSLLHKFITEDGDVLIWITTKSFEMPDNAEYVTIQATVKKHNIFQNEKQTRVLRVKVL